MNAPGGVPVTSGPPRVLVAGLGNIFLGDDGFGVEVVGRLARHPLPPGVETADIGVRGVHLAYQLLDGYDSVVLLDATARGGAPGTVYLIDDAAPAEPAPGDVLIDGHRMTPDAVLALLDTLSAGTGGERPGRVRVVGCEPACLDEGIGLSDPVAGAVDRAVDVVLRLLRDDPPPGRTSAAAVRSDEPAR
ncbi:hydrogenase maturation protease [Streptomyces sp. SL13]|uniref:Hydrogenase maturation protease n=1 Tax=Streptantibioticus silvisoli TaxID=2705255 RepID=A0AA90H3L2_9ACTN|nr:hydrogenase maturation protease [Streptantibioticus silvisoli]MDI5970681.1 hydrogenase maturation protease [Streptantibioticus silvisoli]